MRYVGGKSKIARRLREVILSRTEHRDVYIEPFLGGGAMLTEMAPHFARTVASDVDVNVTTLFEHLLNRGWEPPTEHVTEDEYRFVKDNLRGMGIPSPYLSFVGFGASFGGKRFGGYGRSNKQSPSLETASSLRRTRDKLAGCRIDVRNQPYQVNLPGAGHVVYCDPTYAATTGYASGPFDHDEFWRVMDHWVDRGADVFVSEENAPSHWFPVWEKEKVGTLRVDDNAQPRVERLYMRGDKS